jgi:hypothetical protein
MNRRMKTLGVIFIAIFALAAVAASAASAAKVETVGSGEVKLDGEQIEGKHVFTVEGNKVECTTALFSGSTSNGATKVTVHPEYSGCSAFGFIEATVNTAGCNYELTAANESPTGSMKFAGTLVLNCGTGHVSIIAGTCEAQVGNQTVGSGLTFENTTVSPMDVDLTVSSPVAANKTKDGFACPFSGTGTTTATYTGHTTIKATQPALTQVNLTWVNN